MRYEMETPNALPLSFRWRVNRHGYELAEWSEGDGHPTVLRFREAWEPEYSAVFSTNEADFYEDYDAAARGALHRQFALKKATPEGMLEFINANGLLWPACTLHGVLRAQQVMRDLVRIASSRKPDRKRAAKLINETRAPYYLYVDFDGPVSKRYSLMPGSLFAFMLLLVAAEIDGKAKWRECEFCGQLFKIGDGRANKARFHSDNCRQRAFQQRRREQR